MIALLRRLTGIVRKDQQVLANYQRSHLHFFGYLAMVALLTVVVVFAGFRIHEFIWPSAERLTHSGDVVMSSGELIEHLKKDGIRAYWLGPIQGEEHTVNHEVPGIVNLMYLPLASIASDDHAFSYEVKTYESRKIWDAHTHTILASANTQTVILDRNLTIRINPSSMKGMIVTFSNKPEIVAIAFPKAQSLPEMIQHAKSLKLIR